MNDVKLGGRFEGSRDNQGGAKYSNIHVIMKLIILYRFFLNNVLKDAHKKELIL